jgi:hypothetical protein
MRRSHRINVRVVGAKKGAVVMNLYTIVRTKSPRDSTESELATKPVHT